MLFYMLYTINFLLYWLCLGFSMASSRGSCKESYPSFLNSCKSLVQGFAMLKSRHIPASEIIWFSQKILPTEASTALALAKKCYFSLPFILLIIRVSEDEQTPVLVPALPPSKIILRRNLNNSVPTHTT